MSTNTFLCFFYLITTLCTTFSHASDTVDTLGYGFSAYDGTFDNVRVRSRVLDLGSLRSVNGFQMREKVDPRFIDNLYREKHESEGFNEFATSLKSSVSVGGSFSGFKANVKGHFNSDISERTDYFFSRTAIVIERAQMRVNTESQQGLRNLVIPEVSSFLETAHPASIFQRYGTHVTTRLVVGGMLEYWASSSKNKFSSKTDFSVSVDASFKSLVKGSGSLSTTEIRNSMRVESRENLLIHGGNLQVGIDGEQRWVDSTSTNVQAIRFLPGGAIPIWTLIAKSEQASRVQKHYQTVFGTRSIILKRFSSTPYTNTPRVPHPQASVYVPIGWKVLSGGAFAKFYGLGQLLTKSFPITSRGRAIGWMAASKDHLKSDAGQVEAYAIAMWDPNDEWDVITTSQTSAVAAHPSATATLPHGYILVGGGVDVLYREPGNMMVDSYPVSSNSWKGSSKDHLKSAPSNLVTYAIGMRHRKGGDLEHRPRRLRFGRLQHPNGRIYSTSGWSFVGGGASVSRGGLGNMLVALQPGSNGKEFYSYSKDHLEPDSQYLTIYGIEVLGATYIQNTAAVIGLDPNAV